MKRYDQSECELIAKLRKTHGWNKKAEMRVLLALRRRRTDCNAIGMRDESVTNERGQFYAHCCK